MKSLKKRGILLLLFLIFFVGCSGGGKVTEPDGGSAPVEAVLSKESDGSFYYKERLLSDRRENWGHYLVNWQGKTCILQGGQTEDGRSTLRLRDFESNHTLWEHILNVGEEYSPRIAVSGDEILLGIHDDGKNPKMRWIDASGKTVREAKITEKCLIPRESDALEDGFYFGWEGVGADAEYFYFWYFTKERKGYLTVYRQDGSFVREEDVALTAKLFFDGAGHYYVWDKSLEKRDIDTGTSLYSVPAEFGFDGWTDSERDRLYLLDRNEMDLVAYRMTDGVRLGVEFRFGEDASYIPEGDRRILDGIVGRDRLYLVSSRIEIQPSAIVYEDFGVYSYERVSGVRPPREKTLRVSVPYETTAMRRAKKRFELGHRDTGVKMEAAYPTKEEYLANSESYEAELRKKLTSGEAGDVVEQGVRADFYQLCRDEAFLNLLPYVQKSEERNEWKDTWIGLCENGGALRVLPSEAAVDYLVFHPSLAERVDFHAEPSDCRWSTLLETMKGSDQTHFTDYSSQFAVLEEIVRANLPDLVNREENLVSFQAEWFSDLIRQLKDVKGTVIRPALKNPVNEQDRHGEVLFGVESGAENWRNRLLWVMGVSQEEERKIISSLAGERHANRRVRFVKQWGIPTSASNPDAGWAFLEELMSAEVQEQCEGIPVNMVTLSGKLERFRYRGFSSEMAENWRNDFMKIVSEANLPEEDDRIVQAVVKPLFAYLQGNLSLEEALEQAENEVKRIWRE